MATPIEALEAALYNDGQPDSRKTFGTVEYALIPVSVIEAVIQYAPENEQESPEPYLPDYIFDKEGDSDPGDRDICVVPAVPTAVMGSEEEE